LAIALAGGVDATPSSATRIGGVVVAPPLLLTLAFSAKRLVVVLCEFGCVAEAVTTDGRRDEEDVDDCFFSGDDVGGEEEADDNVVEPAVTTVEAAGEDGDILLCFKDRSPVVPTPVPCGMTGTTGG